MPFTPFHWGPSSWLGLILFRIFDFPALLVASVIVDLEPFTVLVLNLSYPLHGFEHSFLGGSLLVVIVAVILYLFQGQIKKIMAVFRLAQDSSFKKIFWTSLFGVYSHVILDSFLYLDIKPFFPSPFNPFLGLFSSSRIYLFCTFSLLIGVLVYLIRLVRLKKF